MGYFLFSAICYVIGLGSMAVFFWYMQFAIDRALTPFSWLAIVSNFALFLIFPLQHSVLARPFIKTWIQKTIPSLMERPLYVGTSGLAMFTILLGWQPLGSQLYRFETSWPFDAVFYLALILILYTVRTLNHNTMFGLKQGYVMWKKLDMPPMELKASGLFQHIRHPLTSLLIVTLWSHESMSVGRLEWNLLFTTYSLVGTFFEERDLIQQYGESYRTYKREVPAFFPGGRGGS